MAVYRVGGNKSSQNVFPNIRPSLDLDFANSKTLDPRITFTRASGGTYVGFDGLIKYAGVNEARFDHDPVTGESLGLLIEEARTNLFTLSEDVLNAWNIRVSSPIIENSIVAPDGTLTADSFIERTPSSGLGDHYLDRTTISQAANVPLSYSIYVKRLSDIRPISLVLFANSNSSNIRVYFDLNNITSTRSTSGTGSIVDSSITPLPNGWFRLSISGTPTTASVTDLRVRIQLINRSTTYIGDGTSGLYLWGAQLEVGAFPTSYIPTVASTRTRARDSASITGKNFSSFYRQDEGTVYARYKVPSFTFTNRTVFGISSSFADRINARLDNQNIITPYIITNGALTSAYTLSVMSGNSNSTTYTFSKDNTTSASNGTLAVGGQQQRVPLPICNTFSIGSIRDAEIFCSTISRLAYYPKRLPDQQLRALTR